MNFVHKDCVSTDVETLLGPFNPQDPTDNIIWIDDETKLEDILVDHIKAFPSKSQARKNNKSGPIPAGYKEHKIGKKKFWTLKPWEFNDG